MFNHRLKLLFFIILVLMSPHQFDTIMSANQSNEWWQADYEQGIQLFIEGNIPAAEQKFRTILSRNEEIAEAWYGLGLIEQKLHPDSNIVEKYLKKALDISSRYAEAYFQLGQYYTNIQKLDDAEKALIRAVKSDTAHERAWMKLIYVTEQMSQPYPELAAILLPGVVLHNPDKEQLYAIYYNSVLWNSKEQEAIPILEKLHEQNPINSRFAYDLAYLYFLNQSFESAQTILVKKKRTIDKYSNCKRYLLEAKIHFELHEDTIGLKKYWQSVKSISDNRDMRVFSDDIRYIIKENEYEKINADSIADLTEFFERFWRSRDPNLATEENERIPEHYRRIYFSRRNYRRYAPMMFSNELMYKMAHPYKMSNVKIGDEFLHDLLSEPARNNLDVDDVGVIYIRLGEPDKKLFYQCESCSENMSWMYFAKQDQLEMIFHFFKVGGYRSWMIETLPHHFENRWELGRYYNQLDPTASGTDAPPDYFQNIMYFNELERDNIKYAETAMKIERTAYTYEREQLPIPIKILRFKAADQKIMVELYYALSGQIILLEDKHLELAKFLGVYDTTWNQIVRIKQVEKIPLGISQERWQQSMAVRMERFLIEQKPHYYEFQLEDLRRKRLCVYKSVIECDNYLSDEFCISDLLISGELLTDSKSTRYRKGELIYQPHMFTAFNEDDILGLYFEVYNLFYNAEELTEYEVTWNLKQVSLGGNFLTRLFRGKSKEIETTNLYTGRNRDDTVFMNIKLSDKSSGEYELTVTVKDRISGKEAARTEHFSIQ
jgi:tetratricopeptide (TPR) repeat protein